MDSDLEREMKAIAIAAYGGPEVLEMIDRPVPVAGLGEVLIRVKACGVNPADGKWRQGMFAEIVPLNLPHVLGYDVAGALEKGSDEMPRGTPVFAMLDNLKGGGYAEYALAPADTVARIPAGLDETLAAALPTAALTGVQLIEEHIRPATGDVVLITGALGAVGRFALHAAKARGAQTIAGVRANQAQEAMAIGASGVQVLGAPVPNDVLFDHIADTIGGSEVAALCRHARQGARIATVATTPIPAEGLAATPQFVTVHMDVGMLERIAHLVVGGQMAFPVAHVLPFRRAAEAHCLLDAGGCGGKIVLQLDIQDQGPASGGEAPPDQH
jgi:NADPH:quinone reductase-like Zn-dependent oxidoreductase